MKFRWSDAIAALALATGLPAQAQSPAVTLDQARSLGVESVALGAGHATLIEALPAQVTVPNNQMFVVSAPLGALVEQIAVAPGDAVRKGQTLARLASPSLVDTQRGLLQAEAQHRLAKANLERDEKLFAEGIIPEGRLIATRSRYVEARAALEERQQALRLSGMSDASIEKLQAGERLTPGIAVAAPIDGVVLEQMVTAGQRVDAAAPLFRVARLDPLALEIRAPIARIRGVKEGAAVQIADSDARAHIVSIGRHVDAESQTVLLRALVTRGAATLRPGQFVQVAISAPSGTGPSWNVPNAAIARARGAVYVFVETPDGFRAEPVTLLAEGAETSSISGKLSAGARIAVRGTAALKAILLARDEGAGGGQ